MGEIIKKSLREAYAKTLIKLGREHKDIVVVDADLSTSTKTALFGKEFPDRFFNIGISEQSMVGIAAGLALKGKTVFASSFAVFASGRDWDQIRQSVCYNEVDVKIVATHGGITVGEDGATHQSNEDIAIMRILPNMRVIVPADSFETEKVIEKIYEIKGPFYVRLSRENFPVIYDNNYNFELGKFDVMKKGKDGIVFSIGKEVYESLLAVKELEKEGVSMTLVNASSVKPLDKDLIYNYAKEYDRFFVVEEHQKIGGLGSAIAEFITEEKPIIINKIGIDNIFGVSGKADDLIKHFKLDSKGIYNYIKTSLGV
jgi:transketolase